MIERQINSHPNAIILYAERPFLLGAAESDSISAISFLLCLMFDFHVRIFSRMVHLSPLVRNKATGGRAPESQIKFQSLT